MAMAHSSYALESANVAVVVNGESWASIALADAYVTMRGIPATNVIRLAGLSHFETVGVAEFRERILVPMLHEIRSRGLADTIDCIAYSADVPYAIDLSDDQGGRPAGAAAGDRGSLTGLTYLHELVVKGDAQAYTSLRSNRYARRVTPGPQSARSERGARIPGAKEELTTLPFRSSIAWDAEGKPGEGSDGAHYMLATMLGVTSGRGNSVRESIAALERAVAADGTCPTGTVYYMFNGDIRSRTREWGFAAAARLLEEAGVAAVVEKGVLPKNRADIAGAMVGTASFNFARSGSRVLPGAICEHLTSCGGVLTWSDFQTPLTEWLRHGAAGASGTVTEPLAVQAKFPDPFIHVHYARGATLAEAFYQSVAAPYQLLIVGDPLCRPWARVHVAATGRAEATGRAAFDVGSTMAALPGRPEGVRRGLRVVGAKGVSVVSGVDAGLAWWKTAGIAPGDTVTVECFVEAPAGDIHQFQVLRAVEARIEVDGRVLTESGNERWRMYPAELAAGWHAVRIGLTAGGMGGSAAQGAPVEIRFGAAGIRPLELAAWCVPRKGDAIHNVGVRPRVFLKEAAESPLDARVDFGIEGLEGTADGRLSMIWKTEAGSEWSIEPARAEAAIAGGASEPVTFRVRYNGEPFALPGFLPQPVCEFEVDRDAGPERLTARALPLDFMFKTSPRPRIALPRAAQAPKVDGILELGEWAGAATIPCLRRPPLDQPAAQSTEVWLAWDERQLYAAFRCVERELESMRLKGVRRDDSLSLDDSVELFVDADADGETYHQLLINAAGVVCDGFGWDKSWNGDFEAAVGRADGAWTVELAIPWESLGVAAPKAGATIRILCARNRVLNLPPELSLWPCLAGGNHQPKRFADAVLAGGGEK
ncbi:MAG: hypothetical protein FJ224_05830 [Lentisphaerae bacterium]|nr:hypothetical protein [Lentisphaerota bacterium]